MSSGCLDPNIPAQKEQLRRLFRVKKIEGEMLLQREFNLERVYMYANDDFTRIADLTFLQDPMATLETFLARRSDGLFSNRQDFSSIYVKLNHENQVTETVMVLYLLNAPGKLVPKDRFTIVNTYIQTGFHRHMILITETGLGPDSTKSVKGLVETGYNIEVFKDVELAFNRTKSKLAPIWVKHIPSVDADAVAAEEQIQKGKLPLIFNIDTLSKWHGARPLDMFIMEIVGTTTDTAGYYRLVRSFNEKRAGKKPAVKK